MKIALIYSGGTIGCVGTPLAPMEAPEFQALWDSYVDPCLSGQDEIDWRWITPALDSSTMTPRDWVTLSRSILAAAEDVDAVIVLHGTDTMAWSASAVSFLMTQIESDGALSGRLPCPIIFTGSQLPLFEGGALKPETDALQNVLRAFAEAGTAGTGTWIVFGGETLQATRAKKIATEDFRAFASPNGAGVIANLPTSSIATLSDQLETLAPLLGAKAVLTFTPTPNEHDLAAKMLHGMINELGAALGAIVLQGYGIGNVPGEKVLGPILAGAHARGALIVAATQVPSGSSTPEIYDAGHWLQDVGAIATLDMVLPAITAKLHLIMALSEHYGWSQEKAEAFFRLSVAGEIS